MKNIISKSTIKAITLILFLFIAGKIQAQSTNFTGTWHRNDEKTDAGGLSINSVALSLEISQDKKVITIQGNNRNRAGEVSTYTDILKLDGSTYQRKAGTNQTKTISVTWSADGKSLIESARYEDEKKNITQIIKQTFVLSNDGKILRVTDERNFNGQSVTMSEIFDKQ